MGQYWLPVNLDKHEFITPHKLGSGLKLCEQLDTHPGTGAALILLCAAQRERRGGGDLDMDENWHGPEREFPKHNVTPGPMPEPYPEIARRTIGRWAGDRIALVGDYAEDADLPAEYKANRIGNRCKDDGAAVRELELLSTEASVCTDAKQAYKIKEQVRAIITDRYRDITDDVCAVLEHELGCKFVGDGVREVR